MIIYLDTNVYCRPFDNQTQDRIREETDAFEVILEGIRNGRFITLTSDVLQYEITKILNPLKRTEVERYLALSKKRVEEKEELLKLGIVIRTTIYQLLVFYARFSKCTTIRYRLDEAYVKF